jgi:pyrroloquinoline quinone (PQQ) biosynthesis protein C
VGNLLMLTGATELIMALIFIARTIKCKLLCAQPLRCVPEKGIRPMIKISSHPAWIEDFLEFIKPYEDRIVNSRIFDDMQAGKLSIKRFQGGLVNFYPLIENFPKYMALNLAKVPAGDSRWNKKTRYWLITNINQERIHTTWWKQWAIGFGVPRDVFKNEIYPPPEIDAINNYLWKICTQGSLAEGISASNFSIEGPTGIWTRKVCDSLIKYRHVDGLEVTESTLEWIVGHADYDDKHPYEALEIIKAFATSREEQEKVKQAAKRAMEYYELSLNACYELFS